MRFLAPKWKQAMLATMLVVWQAPVQAVTFLDTSYGTPTGTALPRSAAMGATGVALLQGSQAVVHNPALLALHPGRAGFDLTIGFAHAAEDRLVPLFDSFESFVRETTISLNRNTYVDVQGGVLWRLPHEMPMTLAAGVYDRYNFDFDFFEEIRDPSPFVDVRDTIVRTHAAEVEGRLRSLSMGYGSEIAGPVRLGASLHRYFGEVSYKQRVVAVRNPADGTQEIELVRELTGWGWSVGGQGSVNEHLDVAVSFEGEFTVDGQHTATFLDTAADTTSTGSSDDSVRYPGVLRFGLAYKPRNQLRTTFTAEAVRRFWEQLRDSLAPDADGAELGLRDTWDLRVGLEHVFYNGVPVRFGFRFVENYADPASDRAIYSVGLGYAIAGAQLNATGRYQRQTSRQPYLFDRQVVSGGDVFDAPPSDSRVEDSVLSLQLGVAWGF